MYKRNILKLSVVVFGAAFVLSACSFLSPKPNTPIAPKPPEGTESSELPKTISDKLEAQSKMKKFASLDEIKEFMQKNKVDSYYGGFGGVMRSDVVFEELVMEDVIGLGVPTAKTITNDASIPPGANGSDDFSTTNVQVAGVDEADIIKTDGKYIYAVAKNDLYIINAFPASEAKVLSKIFFKSRPQDIYINGDRLVIYGDDNAIFAESRFAKISRRNRNNFTFFKIFDISDRANPKQLRDLDFEGSYTNSRMIGDYVYFLTTTYNYYYLANEPIIPRILEGETELSCTNGVGPSSPDGSGEASCVLPDIYYFDIPYNTYNFTTVTAVNVKNADAEVKSDIYLFSNNQNMYVSPANMYITYTKYLSEEELTLEISLNLITPRMPKSDQEKIASIRSVDSFILSDREKLNKILLIIERFSESLSQEEQDSIEKEFKEKVKQKYTDISKELEKTVIHKIAIGNGEMEYKTFGEVTGQVLNQFSMDENNGYLRIATTKNRTWSHFTDGEQKSYSNVYILDGNLKIVGKLEGLAPDERIYSTRFMQNRVYLVTFKQVDPLFVIDLSAPANPRVLGELKIPGFSDYLHPYDDTTLIGLGKDTSETEWGGVRTKGLKLSLFDVSNVNAPKEIDNYVLGGAGSDSIALNDHKAFLFAKDKNLLVIPVSISESLGGEFDYGKFTFSGAAVFQVTKSGFELKGKIDHSDGGQFAERDYWRGYDYYDNTVKRSLYIDKVLYTFSNNYIKMNIISDLELLKNLELKKDGGSDFEVVN